ncbi:polysaccharide deacetylase family protein [Thalassobacillus sp. B23F22_16]|uniref:polysaccharide deacetylase family protein n=1 Tax=Thalassobacillus sp. B23F22_16 TaxID=3459513 RepID=UPI00373F3291
MKQITVLLIMLVLMTACSFSQASSGEEQALSSNKEKEIKLNISIESIIEEYDEYRLAVHYPQTSSDQLNQVIMDYVKKSIAKFKQDSYQLKQEKKGDIPHELNIDYDILYKSGEIVSITFNEVVDLGGEYPSVDTSVLNFDVSNGLRLKLDRLFKSNTDYVDKLSEHVSDQLLAHEKLGTSFDEAWVKQIASPDEANFDVFSLDSHGMNFYYPISSGENSCESVEVTIPLNKLEGLMKDRYMEALKKYRTELPVKKLNVKAEGAPVAADQVLMNEKKKQIALTFDDGPHHSITERILEVLDNYEAKATFFVLGNRLTYYPELISQAASAGHEIGNHSWNHRQWSRLSDAAIEEQLQRTADKVEELTGHQPSVIKAPYNRGKREIQRITGLPVIENSHDIEIWRLSEEKAIINEVMKHTEDRAIISLQEVSPHMQEVIEPLIKRLTEEGFQLVTVSQLLQEKQPEITGQPTLSSWRP